MRNAAEAAAAGDWLSRLPATVRIVEVGPRDGLQNERAILATEDKVRFVDALADSGLAQIEVSSFVSPRRVPQLADAAEVFASLRVRVGVEYSALVPNVKGLERALGAGVRAIAVFTAASETFTRRNIGMTIAESLQEFARVVPEARAAGARVRGYVSTAFVCPYEGPIAPDAVVRVARALRDLGVEEVSVGDTIGQATPDAVARLTDQLQPWLPDGALAYHFHDTRGMALANVLAALQGGVAVFDSSAGGAGGCPFAPGAAGNVATEDLLTMLHGMGIHTGVDVERVAAASRFLQEKLDHPLPARYLTWAPVGGA